MVYAPPIDGALVVDGSLTSALSIGFLLGLRHALDADHVAAVSTFVGQDSNPYRSCVIGTFWGIGHASTLLMAAVITTVVQVRVPSEVYALVEALVAIVLIGLGGHTLLRAAGTIRLHRHAHTHDGVSHRHLHVHVGARDGHRHGHIIRHGRRPLLMGALHGLAGSAALVLLAVATMPSTLQVLLYITVFGVGSMVGMLAVSGLIGIPFAMTGSSTRVRVRFELAVAVANVGVGLAMLRTIAAL
jgi:high-affinity nickel-transport protein